MADLPRLLAAGDGVLVIEFGDGIDAGINARVHRVARAIRLAALAGVTDIVPSYRSVALHVDPLVADAAALAARVTHLAGAAAGEGDVEDEARGRVVEVPVAYGGEHGPDLADVAAHCGLSEPDVVARHSGAEYRVFMLGFSPGFPYLGGMDPRLSTPRLATPRVTVPAGSVGIAGPQTGIYPTASPGGWRLIGRTPLRLFDAGREPPSILEPGDRVRFVPIGPTLVPDAPGDEGGDRVPADAARGGEAAGVEVLDGGLLTTVQDCGRHGFQHLGVPVAGAMDVFALRAANTLAGNPDTHAGLEMTALGPTLRFRVATTIALAGADLRATLNGAPVPCWQSLPVDVGDTLSCAGPPVSGLRGYLAVAGGIDTRPVLGSRSTYLPSGFGGLSGRGLRAGDTLPLGPAGAARGVRRAPIGTIAPDATSLVRVRVMAGPQDDAFSERGWRTFLSSVFVVSDRSDRVGCRLDGPSIEHRTSPDIVSDGTAFGSVQVAGDGRPIVLMADRGTTGGYTKIATVIAADRRVIAQAAPGTRVRFALIDATVARAALAAQQADIERMAAEASLREAADEDVFDEVTGRAWAPVADEGVREALSPPRPSRGRGGRPPRGAALTAGLSGIVVDVLVQAGVAVSPRQPLVVIEAMKMQNPIRASRAGVVARVGVAVGDAVGPGTIVIEFEE